jgi:ribonuclease HI
VQLEPPPAGFLKLNFNGAEKGNPGITGMGGVIRDSGRNIIWLYTGSMGKSTNNVAKFIALDIGLEILSRERMTNTIVEGESTLIINTVKRLQNGTKVVKVQRHWHLAHSLQKIQGHLQMMNTVELCWVCKSVNSLVDRIANEGVSKERSKLDTPWRNIPNGQFKKNCTHLATKDREGSSSTEGHIERSGERLVDGHDESRQNIHGQHPIPRDRARSDHTTNGGTTSRSYQ